MKADWTHLEFARKRDGQMASPSGVRYGAFYYVHVRTTLIIIASEGDEEVPWEHVSVRAADYKGERIPTWDEMCFVKGLFWDDEEAVVQFHPPKSEYVNNHPHVLHLWKPVSLEIPRPPMFAV